MRGGRARGSEWLTARSAFKTDPLSERVAGQTSAAAEQHQRLNFPQLVFTKVIRSVATTDQKFFCFPYQCQIYRGPRSVSDLLPDRKKKTGVKEHKKRVCSREEAVVYANSKECRFSCTAKMKPVKVWKDYNGTKVVFRWHLSVQPAHIEVFKSYRTGNGDPASSYQQSDHSGPHKNILAGRYQKICALAFLELTLYLRKHTLPVCPRSSQTSLLAAPWWNIAAYAC